MMEDVVGGWCLLPSHTLDPAGWPSKPSDHDTYGAATQKLMSKLKNLFASFLVCVWGGSQGAGRHSPLARADSALGLLPVVIIIRCPSHLFCLLSIQKEQWFCFESLKQKSFVTSGGNSFRLPTSEILFVWSIPRAADYWWLSECRSTALPLILAATLPQETNVKSSLMLMLLYSSLIKKKQKKNNPLFLYICYPGCRSLSPLCTFVSAGHRINTKLNPQPSGGRIHAAVKDLAAETGGPPAAVIQHGDSTALRKAKGSMFHASECDVGQRSPSTVGQKSCHRMPCKGECGKCRSGSVPGWARSIWQLCLPHLFIFLRVYHASYCNGLQPPPCETINGKVTDRGWMIWKELSSYVNIWSLPFVCFCRGRDASP